VASVRIEIVHAFAGAQDIVRLKLAPGAVAAEAVAASGLLFRHGLTSESLNLGMGGRRIPPGRLLHDGDRVEILRPLATDPKEARRARARRRS